MKRPDSTRPPLERQGVRASAINLPPGPWVTLLQFLVEQFPRVGEAQWLQRLTDGLVLDQRHQALSADAPYRPGAKVFYFRHVECEPRIPFDERVLYRDEHLVVADKPHFLPVIPGGRFVQETLLVRLINKLGLPHLTPLHRIDLETAGVVVFCVQPSERNVYHALFRDQQVRKQYEALAPHNPALHFPMRVSSRLEESPQAFMQMREIEGPANAHTDIELVELLGSVARYRLRPITGRKHQLRAQMASLGLPIIGDRIYPVLQPCSGNDYRHPLRLLAQRLIFNCPFTGKEQIFESTQTLSDQPTGSAHHPPE